MVEGETGDPLGPFSVVRVLPTSISSSNALVSETVLLPFLFLQDEHGVRVSHEALSFARAMIASASVSLSTLEREIRTLANLHDFYQAFWAERELRDDDVDYLVYAYLIWRSQGTASIEGCALNGLRWKPLGADTLRIEFAAISRFFNYSARQFGHVLLGKLRQAFAVGAPAHNRMQQFRGTQPRDFFAHLSAAREYWKLMYGEAVSLPPVVSAPNVRGSTRRHVILEEEVWSIIRAERNPAFRALWTLAAFGGIRISEQLNLWQVDVLPSSYRKLAFGYEYGEQLLVVRAHPSQSRYVDDLGRPSITREAHLKRSGLVPRHKLDRKNPLYAGWKGTLLLNPTMRMSEVFWIDPIGAEVFSSAAAEIQEFHRLHKTSLIHPYFYVNLRDSTGEYRGAPLKISNVEAAWDRACRRCGLEPHRWGRNIHGLRHYYKSRQDDNEISPDLKQIMLGHSSVVSQEDYGNKAKQVAKLLRTVAMVSA